MAKKKLSKKNKTLLLTIGAAAVGVGFILAKAFGKKDESNLAGIGAMGSTSKVVKLSDIKKMVKAGLAENITNWDNSDVYNLHGRYNIIAFSKGVYGINGVLIQMTDTGQLYAITERGSNLFTVI